MHYELAKKPTALVVVCSGNEYQRFIGRTLTNHVRSNIPLTADEIEQFRVKPESMLEPETA